MGEGIMFRRKI